MNIQFWASPLLMAAPTRTQLIHGVIEAGAPGGGHSSWWRSGGTDWSATQWQVLVGLVVFKRIPSAGHVQGRMKRELLVLHWVNGQLLVSSGLPPCKAKVLSFIPLGKASVFSLARGKYTACGAKDTLLVFVSY